MMILKLLTIAQNSVAIGSFQHLFPIAIAIGFTILLIHYSSRDFSVFQKEKIIQCLGWSVSLTVIAFHAYQISFESYNFKSDLPLYFCSLMALLIPIFTFYRRYWMFEILVFWIIGGTLQGVITPDIKDGFPSFDYFRYWIAHLGLLTIIFYFIFVFKMRPKLKSLFKSFLALQMYVALIMVINYFLGANYFYLNQKPESASLLDYFGEWPYYILVGQLIVIPLFFIIYLPFYFTNKKENKRV